MDSEVVWIVENQLEISVDKAIDKSDAEVWNLDDVQQGAGEAVRNRMLRFYVFILRTNHFIIYFSVRN